MIFLDDFYLILLYNIFINIKCLGGCYKNMLVRQCDISKKPIEDDDVRFDVTIDKCNRGGTKSFGATSGPYPKRFDLCESCCEKLLSMLKDNKSEKR